MEGNIRLLARENGEKRRSSVSPPPLTQRVNKIGSPLSLSPGGKSVLICPPFARPPPHFALSSAFFLKKRFVPEGF